MKRHLPALLLCLALSAAPVAADPAFRLSFPNGVARVEIEGDWRHSRYTVFRADDPAGPYAAIGDLDVLCVGACFAEDFGAVGGATHHYRFDVVTPDAGLQRFGPYAATIPAGLVRSLSASVSPNPGRGPADVVVFVAGPAGRAHGAEIALFDLQGRRVRQLFHGELAAGRTRIRWDGLDEHGRDPGAGLYLLRVAAWDGRRHVSRVVRAR